MEDVREGLTLVPHDSMIIMMGDFNAKIGHQPAEQNANDDGLRHVTDLLDYTEEEPPTLPRKLADGSRNMYGRELERIAVQEKLVCLNGTHAEGPFSNYTCYTRITNPSVLDLGWCSEGHVDRISKLEVHDFMPDLSDHAPLSMIIDCDGPPRTQRMDRHSRKGYPTGQDSNKVEMLKANWSDAEKELFLLHMRGEPSLTEGKNITEAISTTTTQADMDEINEKVNEMIRTGMKATCNVRLVRKPAREKQGGTCNKPWFTQKCGILKKQLRRWGTALSNTKQKPLPAFYGLKKEYKNEKKRAEKDYKNAIHTRMAAAQKRNPKMWWELLRKLNDTVSHPRLPPISLQVWADHFSTLLNSQSNATMRGKKGICYAAEKDITESMRLRLNEVVTTKELTTAITRLEGHKATFFDSIPNEGIKGLHRAQPEILRHLFTKIMATGYIPKVWGEAYLKPLYKKGDRNNPSNYRGIAISPCLGKVFNSIINARLEEAMNASKINSDLQIGFEKNHMISDHLFVLKTIIEQARICKQDLHLAFIDFRQAYDRIDRIALFRKLITYQIPARIIRIIINQYDHMEYVVVMEDGKSHAFKTTQGLKQGDNMSPKLFNLFIMDILYIFGIQCDPPYLQGAPVYVLMFADDLLLLSLSQTGLQEALDRLHAYCIEWGMEVNIAKTKAMKIRRPHVAAENGTPKMQYNGEGVDWVTSFTYLGVEINEDGSFQSKNAPMKRKAAQAQGGLYKMIRGLSFDTKMWLYNTMVDPILLHGVESWICQGTRKHVRTTGVYDTFKDGGHKPMNGEACKRCFIRLQMGLPRYAPSLAIRGDSGVFPLYIEGMARTVMFWNRIGKAPPDSLLGVALETQVQMADTNYDCWLSELREICANVFPGTTVETMTKELIVEGFQNDYKHQWYQSLWPPKDTKAVSTQLKWYRRLKSSLGKELYLSGPKSEVQIAMARLRIGGHGLPVETGRWKHIEANQRFCLECDLHEIGNEWHLFRCPATQKWKPRDASWGTSERQIIKKLKQPNATTKTFVKNALSTYT